VLRPFLPIRPRVRTDDSAAGGRTLALARRWKAFRKSLAETGYVEGRDVVVECRWAENDNDRLSALAVDLVRRHVAVIVASTASSALAANSATQTIPIVFTMGSDPVALGHRVQPQSSYRQSHRRRYPLRRHNPRDSNIL
jgi:hypothetical protein